MSHTYTYTFILLLLYIYRLTPAEAKELSPFTVRASSSSSGRKLSNVTAKPKPDTDASDGDSRIYKEKNVKTLENMVNASLDPTVSIAETKEYRRYIYKNKNNIYIFK